MSLPSLLVVDPVQGYKFVNRNKSALLDQLYELIGCDKVQLLMPNPNFPDCEIYCDEEGLLKEDTVMNCYIYPFMTLSHLNECMRFSGPRGICVIVSKKFTQKRLLKMFPKEIWEQAEKYIEAMQKAIDDY